MKNNKFGIKSVHAFVKLLIIATLCVVFFLNDHTKIIIYACVIVIFSLWSAAIIYKRPLNILFILFVILGSVLYGFFSGQSIYAASFWGIRLALILILGFTAGNVFSDNELRTLVGNKFAPLLIGSLAGIQRIGDINRDIAHAQIIRGIKPTKSINKLYMWLFSRGYALLVNLSLLAENVNYQFTIRGYSKYKQMYININKLHVLDYFIILFSTMLLIYTFFL